MVILLCKIKLTDTSALTKLKKHVCIFYFFDFYNFYFTLQFYIYLITNNLQYSTF
jgi:hypothetical protein